MTLTQQELFDFLSNLPVSEGSTPVRMSHNNEPIDELIEQYACHIEYMDEGSIHTDRTVHQIVDRCQRKKDIILGMKGSSPVMIEVARGLSWAKAESIRHEPGEAVWLELNDHPLERINDEERLKRGIHKAIKVGMDDVYGTIVEEMWAFMQDLQNVDAPDHIKEKIRTEICPAFTKVMGGSNNTPPEECVEGMSCSRHEDHSSYHGSNFMDLYDEWDN